MLKEVHVKARTAKVIGDAFSIILGSLRREDGNPKLRIHFKTGIDRIVEDYWEDQRDIG